MKFPREKVYDTIDPDSTPFLDTPGVYDHSINNYNNESRNDTCDGYYNNSNDDGNDNSSCNNNDIKGNINKEYDFNRSISDYENHNDNNNCINNDKMNGIINCDYNYYNDGKRNKNTPNYDKKSRQFDKYSNQYSTPIDRMESNRKIYHNMITRNENNVIFSDNFKIQNSKMNLIFSNAILKSRKFISRIDRKMKYQLNLLIVENEIKEDFVIVKEKNLKMNYKIEYHQLLNLFYSNIEKKTMIISRNISNLEKSLKVFIC
jgi:hypothetical protein